MLLRRPPKPMAPARCVFFCEREMRGPPAWYRANAGRLSVGCFAFKPRAENGPPARTRTWTSAFARPCDGFFTTGRKWMAPEHGVGAREATRRRAARKMVRWAGGAQRNSAPAGAGREARAQRVNCTRFPGATGRCPADWATHLRELVGAAGFAPAISRSQAERVGCYATPRNKMGAGVGVAPTAPWLMRPGGNLVLPAAKMVEARGCAPRSRGIQPRAITRSAWPPKKLARTAGNAPASDGFGDRCLPCRPRPRKQNGDARAGVAPA
jgi:hypothetical protein